MFKINLNLLIACFLAVLTSPVLAGSDTNAIYAQDTEVRRLRITSLSEADSTRMKVLQALHVAQAPLHSKQDKASKTEIEAYHTKLLALYIDNLFDLHKKDSKEELKELEFQEKIVKMRKLLKSPEAKYASEPILKKI